MVQDKSTPSYSKTLTPVMSTDSCYISKHTSPRLRWPKSTSDTSGWVNQISYFLKTYPCYYIYIGGHIRKEVRHIMISFGQLMGQPIHIVSKQELSSSSPLNQKVGEANETHHYSVYTYLIVITKAYNLYTPWN